MANANAPFGLSPVMENNGSSWAGTIREYYVPSTDATALYIGDPVILAGSADANGEATVTIATAGATNRITGSVVGFRPSATIVANGYRAASVAEYVLVTDGPGVLYEIQENSVGATLAATDVGTNVNLIAGTGSRITGSGWQLNSNSTGTGATLQVRLVGLQQRPDNAIGANAKWLVRINLPTEAGIASGVGV